MVSIIIASYNYARYLEDVIGSLQHQDYTNWECIIVNDGSGDNTREVVDKIMSREGRVKYIHIENSGPSVARNKGVQASSGAYILFLDADDRLQPAKLSSHLNAFSNDAALDVAYGSVRYFNDGDDNEKNYFFSLKPENKEWIPAFSGYGKALCSKVLRQNIMVTSSPLFKREALLKMGLFDEKLKKLEDWELFQRMVIHDLKLKYVDERNSLVLMRAHPTSYSFNKDDMRSYLLPVLQKNLIKGKVGPANTLYLFLRMIEEYTDLILLNVSGRHIAVRHYFNGMAFCLPLLSLLFLPVYIILKLARLIR